MRILKIISTLCCAAGLLLFLLVAYYLKIYLTPEPTYREHIDENSSRVKLLQNYSKGITFFSPSHSRTVAAMVTSKRHYGSVDLDYPFQSIVSFLFEMDMKKERGIDVIVCNASGSAAAIEKLSHVEEVLSVRNIFRYDNKLKPGGFNKLQKELLDYISCLKVMQMHFPKVDYYLLFEDDAVVLPGFFQHLKQIQSQVDFLHIDQPSKRISHVKLHHPLRLKKIPWLIYLFVFPLFASSLFKLFSELFTCNISFNALLFMGMSLFLFIYLVGADNTGRLHYLLFHYISLVPAESCCTVSILFPAVTLNSTIEYLDEHARLQFAKGDIVPKDTILDWLPTKTRMSALLTEFNLVQHIGMYSTKYGSVDAHIVD